MSKTTETHTKQELLVLLEITGLIANVKNQTELLRLIIDKTKPLFQFEDCGLFVLSSDGSKHSDWASVVPGLDDSELNLSMSEISGDLEHINSPVEYAMNSIESLGQAQLFNFKKLVEKFPDYAQFRAYANLDFPLRDCLSTNLKTGGKLIGMFCINSLSKDYFKPSQFGFFKSVGDAIAIAVANILANQEIERREKEKLALLEITEYIARVRETKDLLKLIVDKIKPLLQFEDCGLFILSPDGSMHSDLAVLEGVSLSIPNLKIKDVSFDVVHKRSVVEWMMKQVEQVQKPILFDFVDLVAQFPDYPQFVAFDFSSAGYRDCLATNLKIGGKTIGMFCINALEKDFFKEERFTIFQNVADTVAIGLGNIVAKEEIEELNKQLKAQNEYLVEEVEEHYNFGEMIGRNPAFLKVCKSIGLVAKTDSTVLILGETGTGKELVARAIHNHSSRKNKTMIKLNCAALPANLIESELFGHERGAFTGAVDKRIGKFELANDGTLFLDEIGELSFELQSKLLRALQEKEIERLGSNKTIALNVRIIAATNRDLLAEVQKGKFRSDLYYRLNIFPVTLPALRERKEDIPLLASYFVQKYAKKIGKNIQGFAKKAVQEMMSYPWMGNIRELEHTIERSVIMSDTKQISQLNLPVAANQQIAASAAFVVKTWEEQERDYLLEILRITNGNVTGKGGAAELLELKPTTLQSKMVKLGIKRKHYVEEIE